MLFKQLRFPTILLLCLGSSLANGQTQSLVVKKNLIVDKLSSANNPDQPFTFSATSPSGSTVPASFALKDRYSSKQPVEVGASVTGTGNIAFTQKDATVNQVFSYASGNAGWTDRGFTALRLDIRSNGAIYYVGTDNNLYSTETAGNIYGGVRDVGVGADDKVYIIGFMGGSTYNVRSRDLASGTYTTYTNATNPLRLDAGLNEDVWYIGSNNRIYFVDNPTATPVDRGLAPGDKNWIDLGVGNDGSVWAIAPNPNASASYTILYKFDAGTNTWVADPLAPTGCTMYNVTVGADNEPLMTLNFNGGRNYLLKRLSDGRWIDTEPQTSPDCNTRIFYAQPTGSYSFTETAVTGYYMQDVLVFGSTGDTYDISNSQASVNLGAGEHAYLEIVNVQGTKPSPQTIGTACNSSFVDDFGTGTGYNCLTLGQATYFCETKENPAIQGVNDGFYALTPSVTFAKGNLYQWIGGATDHDHTGNTNGQMLLVNADFGAGIFYEKEYTGLVVGGQYRFSAWLANVLLAIATDATDPNVILKVVNPNTGAVLLEIATGDIPKSTTNTLDWVNFAGTFVTDASTVKVYLINNKPGGQGNDLVMDDISFSIDCPNISGNVFNDGNGLTNGLVDGTGTNLTSQLFAVLIGTGGTYITHVPVEADGSYLFPNLVPGNYSVQITSSTPSNVTDDATLPTSWVAVGDYFGSNNGAGSGNVGPTPPATYATSLLTQAVTLGQLDVTQVNFGIDHIPVADNKTTATQANPGGTATVVVPTLTGSDLEDGSYTGVSTTNTIKIETLPTEGTLYYNGVAVTVGQEISNYNPALLTVDPIDGNATVIFTYSERDNAGVFGTPATVEMPFGNPISISGNVYFEIDGNRDNQVDGTTQVPSGIYAVLIETNGTTSTIAAVQAIDGYSGANPGVYSFSALTGTQYQVYITTVPPTVGTTISSPTSTLPSGYQNINNNLSDLTLGSLLGVGNKTGVGPSFTTLNQSVVNMNFGVVLSETVHEQ